MRKTIFVGSVVAGLSLAIFDSLSAAYLQDESAAAALPTSSVSLAPVHRVDEGSTASGERFPHLGEGGNEGLSDTQQIGLGRQWLQEETDLWQRINGIQQLSAYPSIASEELLMQALSGDPDAEARAAAAVGLGQFEHPSEQTIATLLLALEDSNEEVQANALIALQDIDSNEEGRSRRHDQIVVGLRSVITQNTRGPSDTTRDSIAAYLDGLAS